MSGERLAESWARIEEWLAAYAVEAYASLRPPADPAAVDAAQHAIGVTFPDELLGSLARHDGCDDRPGGFRLPRGQRPLSVAEIVGGWQQAVSAVREAGPRRPFSDNPAPGSRWAPIMRDPIGDLYVLNCQPGEAYGTIGKHRSHYGETQLPRAGLRLGDLWETLAETFRLGQPFEGRLPAGFEGRLYWEAVRRQHPAPRSPLGLAAAESGPLPAPVVGVPEPAPDPEVGWISGYDNVTLTFVHRITQAELFRRFGVDPARSVSRTRRQLLELERTWTEGYRPALRVGYAGDWAFAVEEFHSEGGRPERLRRLSAGTWAAALHYAAGHLRLTVVADGTVVFGYDNHRPESPTGTEPDRFLPMLRAAGLAPPDHDRNPDLDVPALLDVLRAEWGIVLDGRMLAGALPAAQYRPLLPESPPPGDWAARSEPGIRVLLAHAPEPRLRSALVAQARRLATETGLDGYPELAEALDRMATGERWRIDEDSPCGLRMHEILAEAQAARHWDQDPRVEDRLDPAERAAWGRRAGAVEGIVGLLCWPLPAVARHLLTQRLSPDWRAEFVADLGPVTVPGTALQELLAAEVGTGGSTPALRASLERARLRKPRRTAG
ncbi:DUF6461 domain-containing protein [Plantactinospora soyae]|uniref:Cell wall assembly regulator SMI1 n=1 Tax=Plantactinospora soyae TaxID=1544732 RepID=A0A927M3B3_9ACTN|nr:DUF6461 domain-containing protein [Plantactinospora soyae]MBE1486889.1 cell wall assembly regulator SMI1 [Plantactinospora soyae]